MPVEPLGPSVQSRIAFHFIMLASRLKWAEPEVRGLRGLVQAGDAVIDVGASHGMYTVPLAHLVGPSGRVEAFEPHPRQQSTLRRWSRMLKAHHIRVNPSAVGHQKGQLTMRLPVVLGLPIYGRAHLTEGAAPLDAGDRVRQWATPISVIDDWVAEHHIERVSFIKADVEGFEPRVLDGAARTIERDLPSLLLEIEDRHLARYGDDALTFTDVIRRRWPEYGMYCWRGGQWVPAASVTLGVRNYLFATEAAFARH